MLSCLKVPEYCKSMEEADISDNSFNLIFAFDEIVALGYRESVNLAQIRTFVEMDSHEEKVYQAVRKVREFLRKFEDIEWTLILIFMNDLLYICRAKNVKQCRKCERKPKNFTSKNWKTTSEESRVIQVPEDSPCRPAVIIVIQRLSKTVPRHL